MDPHASDNKGLIPSAPGQPNGQPPAGPLSPSPGQIPPTTSSQDVGAYADAAAGDPRERVTPEAFFVAPELLGQPLAKPIDRAKAWAVDGVIVGMLSQAGSFLLAVALAVLSYQLITRRRQQNSGNGQLATVGKLPVVLMAIFIGWAVLTAADWLFDDDSKSKAAPAAEVSEKETEAAVTAALSPLEAELHSLRAENAKLKAEHEGFSLIETGRQLLDDIGFGFGWAAVYFSLLTAWWQGQTVGKRLFGVRVVKLNGRPLTVWESFNRYGGYAAGFATGLLGFAQVFWDANRQAIHDQIAFTVVLKSRQDTSV